MARDDKASDVTVAELVPTTDTTKPSHREILKKRQYKRRRMYKLAFKTLMTQLEDHSYLGYSSDSGSDDLLDSGSDSDGAAKSKTTRKEKPQAPEEKPAGVIYRANLYTYHRAPDGQQRPEFERSVQGTAPIPAKRGRGDAPGSSSFFEVTTMYAVPSLGNAAPNSTEGVNIVADMGTYITIQSEPIFGVLRDIIKYYPQVLPFNEKLLLREPYCLLIHYREELTEYLDQLNNSALSTPAPAPGTNVDQNEHLKCVLDFITDKYQPSLLQEDKRHQGSLAMCTFEWVWLLFKPGTSVYGWENGILRAYTVEMHSMELSAFSKNGITAPRIIPSDEATISQGRRPALGVTVYWLDFDGISIGPRRAQFVIDSFDGEMSILSLPIFPKQFLKNIAHNGKTISAEDYLVDRGRLFLEMTKVGYREAHTETLTFPKRPVSRNP